MLKSAQFSYLIFRCYVLFKITMTGKKLAVCILLIVLMELLFCGVDSIFWDRRRRSSRRRRALPICDSSIPQNPVIKWHNKWHNKWHQSFSAYCPNSKFLDAVSNHHCCRKCHEFYLLNYSNHNTVSDRGNSELAIISFNVTLTYTETDRKTRCDRELKTCTEREKFRRGHKFTSETSKASFIFPLKCMI